MHMDGKSSLNSACNHISRTADRLRCYQLKWTVSVINCWLSSGARHCVARVCQRQRQRRRVQFLKMAAVRHIEFVLFVFRQSPKSI